MSDLRTAGFFIVRTPYLPFGAFRGWGQGLESPAAATNKDDVALGSALEHDRVSLRARLRTLLDDRAIREAIYVASPSLTERIPRWIEQPKSKDGQKLEPVLVRYLSRMACRATPFGLFAGVTVGRVGQATELVVSKEGMRHVRLDMEYLIRIVEHLERDPPLRAALHFRPNRMLFETPGRYHYPEIRVSGAVRAHELVSVQRDEPLEKALAAARTGARPERIAAAVVDDEVGLDEARAYVNELIDGQVLVSDLSPPLTCDDPLAAVVTALAEADGGEPADQARRRLVQVAEELSRMNGEPPGLSRERYEQAAALLAPFGVEAKQSHVFQVDMSRSGHVTLAAEDVAAIAEAVEVARAFAQRDERRLKPFVDAFVARYDRREVPLMEALDDEAGIGFVDPQGTPRVPAPLLAGIRAGGGSKASATTANRMFRFLAEHLERIWTDRADVLRLEPSDATPFAKDKAPLPDSLAAMVTILGPERGAENRRRRFLFRGFSGPSAARTLARFCFWSPELTELLANHLREEERLRPDALFAEIVHTPLEARAANVLVRPKLRRYEIALCCRPGVPEEDVILLSDLRVSVRDESVVLRSARLDREIVPRLSAAHMHQMPNSLGAYRFLAALQEQGCAKQGFWSWGPFAGAAFLPRVEVGNVILSPRRWSLDKATLKELTVPDGVARFRAFQRLRAARRMPRFVGLVDDDNVLPVDLDNALSIDALVADVKRQNRVTLTELFYEDDALLAESPAGRHTHELMVPLLHPRAEPARDPVTVSPATPVAPRRERRQFGPGSEWLFAKIYGSPRSGDDTLVEHVRPLVASFVGTPVDGWFFIRYWDPDPHLRLRLHGPPSHLFGTVLPDLERRLSPMMRTGQIARLELATYEREMERYGGDEGIGLCERIFQADSEAALRIVEAIAAGEASERERWRWALAGVDRMLSDFGLDIAERRRLVEAQHRMFVAERGRAPAADHAIGARFRKERAGLEKLLHEAGPTVNDIFQRRSSLLVPLARELRARTPSTFDEIAASLVHMWNNRVLLVQHRRHELVIHDFLTRLYESVLARARVPVARRGG